MHRGGRITKGIGSLRSSGSSKDDAGPQMQ